MNPVTKINTPIHNPNAASSKQLTPSFNRKIVELSRLVDSYEKKRHVILTTLLRCAYYCRFVSGILFREFTFNQTKHHHAVRSQGHLCYGSNVRSQQRLFKKALAEKKGANFVQLKNELNKMVFFSAPVIKLHKKPYYTTKHCRSWSRKIEKQIHALSTEKSFWIDGSTTTGRHAVALRVTKNVAGSYDIHLSNTGSGLENDDFHPQHNGIYQTIALIKNVSRTQLNRNFFYQYGKLARIEIPGLKGRVIDHLYTHLRTLGKPTEVTDKRYHPPKQINGSCAPACLWAMSSVVLSSDEHHEFQFDDKLSSLKSNYRAYKSGINRTKTNQILILDLIEAVKGEYYKNKIEIPAFITKIEKDLYKKRNLRRNEITLKKGVRRKNNPFLSPPNSKAPFTIKANQYRWNATAKSLIAKKINRKPITQSPSYDVKVDERNPDLLIGKTHIDATYLLYEAIATGSQKKCDFYLKQAMASRNSVIAEQEKTKTLFTAKLILDFVKIMDQVMVTRSDRAKLYFLYLLAKEQISKIPNIHTNLDVTILPYKSAYDSLEIELCLSQDRNIWVNAINELKAK